MPNWKKVVTSGSNAELNQITASTGINTEDIHSDADINIIAKGRDIRFGPGDGFSDFVFNLEDAPALDVTGNFTIDCSGDITLDAAGDDIRFRDQSTDRFVFNLESAPILDVTGDFTIDGAGDIKLDSATNVVDLIGNVTASGNISASNTAGTHTLGGDVTIGGKVYADKVYTDSINGYPNQATLEIGDSSNITHITASGNISSSGYVYADRVYVENKLALSHGDSAGSVRLGYADDIPIEIGRNAGNSTSFTGHITASGNISASGTTHTFGGTTTAANLTINSTMLTNRIDTVDNVKTGVAFGDGINVIAGSHITASGNISASGDITASNILLDGDIVIPQTGNIYLNGSDTGDRIEANGHQQIDIRVNNQQALVCRPAGQVGIGGSFTGDEALNVDGIASASGFTTQGHITASGGMSVTGTGSFAGLNIGGGLFTSASLAAGGGGSTDAAGSDTQVQFNDGGTNFGGDAGLVFNKTSNLLTAGAITSTGDITANGNIVGDDNTTITHIASIALDSIYDDASEGDTDISLSDTTLNIQVGGETFLQSTGTTAKFLTNITASGNISASGQITASSFKGDGAGLTNVSATVGGNTFATDLKIGRDADNLIDFTADNEITFRVSTGDNVVMKASGEIEATSLDISGDIDVDGTSNLDVVDVDGAADFASSITMASNQFLFFDEDQLCAWRAYNTPANGRIMMNRIGGVGGLMSMSGSNSKAYVGINTGVNGGHVNEGLTVNGMVSASLQFSTESHISASGNISASGKVIASEFEVIGSGTAELEVQGHITASGNIITTAAESGSGGNYIGNRRFNKTSDTDATHLGDIVYLGGTAGMDNGKIYHYKSDGTWELANADDVSTADGLLAVALGTNSDIDGVLLRGMVTLDHDPGAVGDVLYVQSDNAGTPGEATATKPAVSGDIVRVVGYCLDASNGQIWFNPDNTFVEVA